MKEILQFDYLDNKYGLLIKDSKLVYIKYINDNISYDLLNTEKSLIKEVLINLFPTNNICDLGYIEFNNEYLKHLFDYGNQYHIFCDKENNINNNCLLLNYIYNNQEESIMLLKNNNYMKRSQSRYVRRNVKIRDRVISVLALSAFLLTISVGAYKGVVWLKYFNEKDKYEKKVLENIDKKITISDIENAINFNSKLSKEEKEFFLSNPEFFYENLEYFDYFSVINNLNNLYVEYINESSEKIGMYGDFTRSGKDTGRIRIYNAKNFETAKRYALTHEFLHAFTTNYNPYTYVYEGIHVIFNNEYFSDKSEVLYDDGYGTIRNYMYILCELIDENVLRKYHADDNINYLADALIQIIPSKEQAFKLLNNIDKYCENEIIANGYDMSLEDIEKQKKLEKEIEVSLKLYYETKYQTKIEDNDYIFFLFNSKHACTKIASELNFDIETFKLADEVTTIKQYKKIFNKDGNDNLILNFCNSVKSVPKTYTLEEVLNGKTGRIYQNKESIDLKMNEDGTYIGYIYEPNSYVDYEVKSYKLEDNELKR